MINRKYKIGNLNLEVNSELDFDDDPKLSQFLVNGGDANYSATVNVVDSLEVPSENPIYQNEEKVCYSVDGKLYSYYKNVDSFGKNDFIYAYRKVDIDKCRTDIYILNCLKEKFCSRTFMIFLGFEEIAAIKDSVIFHSSYIELDGRALIFTGPCGIGKSTQAKLWHECRNTPIINGDKTLLYIENGVAMAGGLPFSGSSKFCKNKSLPILAIVKLNQGENNKIKFEKGFNSFITVLKSCYTVACSERLINKQTDFAEKFSKSIPVINYECLPDESSVTYLEEKLCQIM